MFNAKRGSSDSEKGQEKELSIVSIILFLIVMGAAIFFIITVLSNYKLPL